MTQNTGQNGLNPLNSSQNGQTAEKPLQNTEKPPETLSEPKRQAIVRRYRENTSFFSDLFRLQLAKLLQWKGWTKVSQNAPKDENGNLNDDWVLTPHCHYFHTFDSNGKKQEHCQPVAQHVHKMQVVRDPENPDDILEVRCVSGPLKWVITEKFGKRQKILEEDPHDKHRHDTEYIKSNQITQAKMNSDAVKVISRATVAATSKAVFDEDGKPLGNLAVR